MSILISANVRKPPPLVGIRLHIIFGLPRNERYKNKFEQLKMRPLVVVVVVTRFVTFDPTLHLIALNQFPLISIPIPIPIYTEVLFSLV